MPRSHPHQPAWLREWRMPIALPLTSQRDPLGQSVILKFGPERYTMACTIIGRTRVFLIAWWARDPDHAEATFRDWLDKGFAILSRTFFDEPCRYVLRTGAVTGFVVLPERADDQLDELLES